MASQRDKNLRQGFVANNMLKKCANFHKGSLSGKKVKFNIPSAIELSEISVAHLTNVSFEFFYKIFTEDTSLLRLYHGAKKSKLTKNLNSNQEGVLP